MIRPPTKAAHWAALTVLTGSVLYRFVVLSVRSVAFPFPLDYGEGAVLDVARRLAHGENVYPPAFTPTSWFVANYPPLYYAIRAFFIWVLGPQLWHGRLFSQLCAVGAAALIAAVVDELTRNRLSAIVSGLTFLAIPFVAAWAQYDRVDLLALLFSWAGIWFLIRTRRNIALAALCFVASSFSRQTGAVAGLAAAYCWVVERRQPAIANRIAGSVASLGAVLIAVCQVATGGFVFHVITATTGESSLTQLVNLGRQPIETIPLLLAIVCAAVAYAAQRRPPGWTLLIAYAAGAALIALSVAKTGSYINYFLDLAAACALACGLLTAWLWSSSPRLAATLLLAIAVQTAAMTVTSPLYARLNGRLGHSAGYRAVVRAVGDVGDPVLADEPMALLALLDRPVEFHPFAMTQLARAGLWDQRAFLERVRNRRYTRVLLRLPSENPRILRNLWTDEMAQAIEDSYWPVTTIPIDDVAVIAVYEPKRER